MIVNGNNSLRLASGYASATPELVRDCDHGLLPELWATQQPYIRPRNNARNPICSPPLVGAVRARLLEALGCSKSPARWKHA